MEELNKNAEIKEVFNEIVHSMPLADLMAWDGNLVNEDYVDLPALASGRPAIRIKVRSLSSAEHERIRKQATQKPNRNNRRLGITEGLLDTALQRRLTIFNGIVEPNLADSQLQSKFNRNSSDFTVIVDNIFLMGEQITLMDKILELSGIVDDEDESEDMAVAENPFLPE